VPGEVIAAGCLAVAGGWRALVVGADVRHIHRVQPDGRAYRPELGWADGALLGLRRWWAWTGLLAAGALVLSLAVSSAATLVWTAAGVTIAAWLARDGRLHHGRYASVCIATLAVGVALAGLSISAAGLLASVAAGQLYLVAGIRKLRSREFMSGRVLLDNVAYGACQAAAGNREFLRTLTPSRLADLLERGTLLRGCRVASVATAAAELAVGLGSTGLLPPPITFGIAVPMHLGFTLLSPVRLLSFTAASLGLLALATVHPVFAFG
jgi:hypothetical protein